MKNFVLFSGGRGNKNLIHELIKDKEINLFIIVNGFDDGLSTGRLRKYLGNILGPSDFRKNISYVGKNKELIDFLDYRLPENYLLSKFDEAIKYLEENDIKSFIEKIKYCKTITLDNDVKKYLLSFVSYEKKQRERFNYSDCALGNLIFCGIFLETQNFQNTIDEYSRICGVPSNIKLINIDEGKNLKLVALLSTGKILEDEVSIVDGWDEKYGTISNIFLVKFEFNCDKLKKLNYAEKFSILKNNSIKPLISDLAKSIISKADKIIYGSGTQYSSLFPTYLILEGYMSQNHKNIDKIFIPNLEYDNDINHLYIEDLIDKILSYQLDVNNINNSITYALIDNNSDHKGVKLKYNTVSYKNIEFIKCDLNNHGKHKAENLVLAINSIRS